MAPDDLHFIVVLALTAWLLSLSGCVNNESEAGSASPAAMGASSGGGGYQPRIVEAGGEHAHTNRLIHETSPYLLQHAHNPVDWYPWGPEAFAAARDAGKPIFLSIGYSTCYWCHVMERESFENEAIAAYMNENFICIKVDREERPDIDDIYMTAVQFFSQGHGGWPMSLFLEPMSLKPFFGGTYFPAEDNGGRPGFLSLLTRVNEFWGSRRDELVAQANQAATVIQAELQQSTAPVALDANVVDLAVTRLMAGYDEKLGGFDQAPKFPQPIRLRFLMDVDWDDKAVQAACLHTLDAMALGGMYDQVGGGFHRYSTDAKWLVPHFEKMLYDNGQLASVYALAIEKTGDAWYAQVLRSMLDYVLREMQAPSGRFYSAQDAEVDAREGGSYIWSPEEIREALESRGLAGDVEFTLDVYGLAGGPNFRDPHHQDEPASNVLFLSARPEELAAGTGMSAESFGERLHAVNAALLEQRNTRPQPITDDKTLAGWNGLMIAGLADAGRVLDDGRYVDAAREAARFLLEEMVTDDGGLLRSYRDGKAAIPAFLEDYAFVVDGLLALNRADGDGPWLDAARELMDAARQRFLDGEGGGYFDTLPGQDDLFVRAKSRYDGATPTGNSQMLVDLLDLFGVTADLRYLNDASATLGMLSQRLRDHPTSALLAVDGLYRMAQDQPDYLPTGEGPTGSLRNPVQVSVDPEVVDLGSGDTELHIRMTVAEGFHINAHDPGNADLIGLRLSVVGEGVDAQVDYPEGELFRAPFSEDAIRVHEGLVELDVRLRSRRGAKGSSRLVLSYQVCDDEVCLAPVDEVLPVVFR